MSHPDILTPAHFKRFLIHIPHSSTYLPETTGFHLAAAMAEIARSTDWATEQLFAHPLIKMLVVPFSRVFCDVERFTDADEPMFEKGQGIAYTATSQGAPMREMTPELKQRIIDEYYTPHHQQLTESVREILATEGQVIIIDGHSFSDHPTRRNVDPAIKCPDICLGTDEFHTPAWVVQLAREFFAAQGFSVDINVPYAGTIVPLAMYHTDPRVMSLMIEVRKGLYMDEEALIVDQEKVKMLNKLCQKFLTELAIRADTLSRNHIV